MTAPLIARAFFDLSEEDIEEAERTAAIRYAGFGKHSDWDDILRSRLIFLFAEAQSGKTFECKERQQMLWDAGEPAFYAELVSVAGQPWREIRSPDETERLEQWRKTESQTATIFLDSVDELALTQGKFRTALINVANDLAGHMARVRLVLTSRPLPVERDIFIKTFAAPTLRKAQSAQDFASVALGRSTNTEEGKETRAPEIRYVSLIPLSMADVRSLAASRGVENVDGFIDGLAAASMLDLMRRPQDVIEAASAWIELRGKFGTHAQQVEFDTRARLKPNAGRPDRELSPTNAWTGASRLALAVVLTQRLTIRYDVNTDTGDAATVIDPSIILPDWSREPNKALLERGLFGFATYGRVRFHNRIAFEFLAAARLSELIEAGLSRKAVRRLLVIETAQGREVVRPTLHDVAAWLALRQPWVFDLLCKLDPALLFNLGDPGSLSIEQRQAALQAFIDRYGKGGWRGLTVPDLQVRRFADPRLAPAIRKEFAHVENPEVRQLLLDLIGEARLAECADIATGVLWKEGISNYERADALDALVRIGDPGLAAVAEELRDGPEPWDHKFARIVIDRLFPSFMTVDQLVAILGWVEETSSTGWELCRNLPPMAASLDQAQTRALISGLLPRLTECVRFDTNLHALNCGRPHLVPLLGALCAQLFDLGNIAPQDADVIVLATNLSRGSRRDDDIPQRLADAIACAHDELRGSIFEAEAELWKRTRPADGRVDLYIEMLWRGSLRLTPGDRAWVRAWVKKETLSPVRDAALACEIYHFAGEAPDHDIYLAELQALISDDTELAAVVEKRLALPDGRRQRRKYELCDQRRRRQEALRDASAVAGWVEFWRELTDDPDTAFGADRVAATARNLWRVMRRSENRSHGSGWDRQLIEDHFGKDIADRLRSALLPLWRRETPPLASEQAEEDRGLVWDRWRLALVAIAAEAEDPCWASNLSPDLAAIAVRYARWNLNGFPAWLDAMAAAHPAVVDSVIGSELTWTVECPASEQHWSITLQNIRNASPELSRLFLPRLRDWLEKTGGLPRDEDSLAGAANRLDQIVSLLFKFGGEEDRDRLRETASNALALGSNEPLTRVWLPTLFAIDPVQGVAALEALCADVPISRESAAVGWIAELFGRHHHGRGVNLKHESMTADLLVRLLRFAYRHVDPSEDAVREGCYSPDLRDNGESGRNTLLNAVLELEGTKGWKAKLEIANDPQFVHARDRFHAIAVEKSAREADNLAMLPAEVVKLDDREEPGPRSPAEMYALLIDRIDDLKDHLLSDTSPRELWSSVKQERVMRRAIAEHLEGKAKKAYTVGQENVTADEKETDIRLRSTACNIEGVIELKIGDKPDYSGAKLRSVIADQLVGKYLAPEGRRAGILLITRATRNTWQHPDTSAALDFDGLIAMLQQAAHHFQEGYPEDIHIDVIGIDLKPRLPTERAARDEGRAGPAAEAMRDGNANGEEAQ